MSQSEFNYYGVNLTEIFGDGQNRDFVEGIADQLVEEIKANLGTEFPPASLPGGFPHKRSGDLQLSVKKADVDGDVTVIVETDYAHFLELGTSKMEPRPFVIPSLENVISKASVYIRDLEDKFRKIT